MQETGRNLFLQIGGVPLQLSGEEGPLLQAAQQRYGFFSLANPGAFPIQLETAGGDFVPHFRHQLNGSWLEQARERACFSGVKSVYDLDSLLRILLSQLLVQKWGFLLHAATIEHQGRAYVFMGRSGAGKSTIASLSPAGSVFTDEISLVRKVETWQAFGTPFWGEFRAEGQNRSAPVAGIFALVQAQQNRKVALSARQALAELLGNTLFFAPDREARERLLEIYSDLIRTIPAFRLEFRKDCSFWKELA